MAKIGLSATTGPTIEMSPPALARTSRYDIAAASTTEARTHGHMGRARPYGAPVDRKYTAHTMTPSVCVQKISTSGERLRARRFTTANCPAWVRAAARASANHMACSIPALGGFAGMRYAASDEQRQRRYSMAQTRARISKHPIHPMLVVFPIGLWVAALVFDIVHAFTGNPLWRTLAFWNIAG